MQDLSYTHPDWNPLSYPANSCCQCGTQRCQKWPVLREVSAYREYSLIRTTTTVHLFFENACLKSLRASYQLRGWRNVGIMTMPTPFAFEINLVSLFLVLSPSVYLYAFLGSQQSWAIYIGIE